MAPLAVVDTNVVVAGFVSRDPLAPTTRVVKGMAWARFRFLVSTELVAEYREVLLRPHLVDRHGESEESVDHFLEDLVMLATVREPPTSGARAPDPGDQHLWDLLAEESEAVLVTGDRRLLESDLRQRVVSPSRFIEVLDWTRRKT